VISEWQRIAKRQQGVYSALAAVGKNYFEVYRLKFLLLPKRDFDTFMKNGVPLLLRLSPSGV